MKAALITRQGDPVAPNIATTTDHPAPPDPPPGQVTIKPLASALNQMDLWVGRGVPGLTLDYPRVSGCDACAQVAALGPGVDPAWHGARVIMNAAVTQPERVHPFDPTGATLAPNYELIGEHHHGAHQELLNVPAANLVRVADDADPHAAAAFGLTALTAYSMMLTKGRLRPGQTVLITGIGGGVALAALHICNWLACPTIVTSRHQWKLDRATELGAAHAILDEGQDWSKDVRAFTNKRGVDMAVDSIGKPTHLSCIKSLARGGAFVTPGNTGGPKIESDQARIFWNQLRVLGSTMGSTDELKELAALFDAGKLGATVDSVHPWHDAQHAWQRLESQEQFGKVVLDWTA